MNTTMMKEMLLEGKKAQLLSEFIEHTRTLMDYAGELDDVDHDLETVIQGNMKVILTSPAD